MRKLLNRNQRREGKAEIRKAVEEMNMSFTKAEEESLEEYTDRLYHEDLRENFMDNYYRQVEDGRFDSIPEIEFNPYEESDYPREDEDLDYGRETFERFSQAVDEYDLDLDDIGPWCGYQTTPDDILQSDNWEEEYEVYCEEQNRLLNNQNDENEEDEWQP